jgi:hypothetical protein
MNRAVPSARRRTAALARRPARAVARDALAVARDVARGHLSASDIRTNPVS